VEFAWEPVVGASRYDIALFPDDDYVVKNDEGVTVAVTEPRWRGNLSPGTWSMELYASAEKDEMIGRLAADKVIEVYDPTRPEPVRPANCPEWLPIPLCDKVPVADRENVERKPSAP
jgi:hypothetical protein